MSSLVSDGSLPKVALSEQMVKSKTRVDRLDDVKSLNCWGQDLTDVSILSQMPSVEVLSLSVNKISSLKDFSQCIKLQELYLRKNEVTDIDEVRWLAHLPDLHVLWLSDNPCAEVPQYRQKVLQLLPKLTKLDNDNISAQDKSSVDHDNATAQPKSEMPLASRTPSEPSNKASTALPDESNSVLGQVHKPAELQAAMAAASGKGPQPTAACLASNAPAAMSGAVAPASLPRSPASFKRRIASGSNAGSNSNVLYAVMALLGELDDSSLHVVKAEVEQRLAQQ